jgi:hypothetical protein
VLTEPWLWERSGFEGFSGVLRGLAVVRQASPGRWIGGGCAVEGVLWPYSRMGLIFGIEVCRMFTGSLCPASWSLRRRWKTMGRHCRRFIGRTTMATHARHP